MRHCVCCGKMERYTWLSNDGYCYGCIPKKPLVDDILASMVSETQGSYSWPEWAGVANYLREVDMGCRFDCDGCTLRTNRDDPRACCAGCANSLGYLKSIPEVAHDLLLSLYDPVDGFWTQAGCTIPWRYRSPTCLSYRCKLLRSTEDKTLWPDFYRSVGLGMKEYLPILEKLPKHY